MVSLRCPCPGDRTIPTSGSDATFHTRDFWVDVTVRERDGRYMATADLGEDSRDAGVGDTPWEAVIAVLRSLGEPYASEMAVGVTLSD
jgi:hypothetical protein